VSLILSGHWAAPAGEWARIVRNRTDYPDFEIIEVRDREPGEKATVGSVSLPPHWTAILSAAAGQADGEVLCFLDAGLKPISGEWLREMVSFAIQPEIGVVGPRLLNTGGTVAGSGLLLGVGGTMGIAHEGFLRNNPGNMSRNRLICNYSAVSSSCLMIRRDMFEAVGGFDAENLRGTLYDADLCLRVRQRGSRVTVTPFAELKWAKGPAADQHTASRNDRLYFEKRWAEQVANDPFHNPNLSKERTDFSIKI
jgi:GT2 family glycosyltransferase